MIPASGVDDILASPTGRYLAGPASVSFIVDPSLAGVSVWGRPSSEHIRDLAATHEQLRPVLASPTTALVDVRYLEWPDPSAFAALTGYITERHDWLAARIDRLALVRPRLGPVGAFSAGFFSLTTNPFTVETFTALGAALEWIGRKDATEIESELEALIASSTGTPLLLRRLRALLEAQPGALSLDVAAAGLGVTERSLQRRLKSCDTTFQTEQNLAQVRVAQRLLVESDAPLKQIASQVGCTSLSRFSTLFRRVTGKAPSDWRKGER